MNESATPTAAAKEGLVRAPLTSSTADADAGPPEFDAISRFLLRHRLLIGTAAIAGTIAGLGLAWVQPKIYRAEVLVTPVTTEVNSPLRSLIGQYSALAGVAGIDLAKPNNSTSASIAMLKSRLFVERFIADRGLLPVLFQSQWDPAQGRWRLKAGESPPSLQDGYELFVKNIMRVMEDRERNLITISVEWKDPALAAEWANALVQRLNEMARNRAVLNADRSIDYLGKELEHTQAVEIRASIYSSLQLQINNRMLANTRPDFAFSVIDPAQAPERNKYVRPVPLLLAAIGFFCGTLLGMVAAAVSPYSFLRASRRVRR